jgi:predicted transcriptional regulator
MIHSEKVQFGKDVEELVKPILQQLYIKYGKYDSVIIHAEFVNYMQSRNHSKFLKFANSKKHRRLRFKKLQCELETVRVERELKEFEDSL